MNTILYTFDLSIWATACHLFDQQGTHFSEDVWHDWI